MARRLDRTEEIWKPGELNMLSVDVTSYDMTETHVTLKVLSVACVPTGTSAAHIVLLPPCVYMGGAFRLKYQRKIRPTD